MCYNIERYVLLFRKKRRNMFIKPLASGKFRYYLKFYDDKKELWKQVSCTMNTRSREAKREAENRLSKKIDGYFEKEYSQLSDLKRVKVKSVYEEWIKFRKQELRSSTLVVEKEYMKRFLNEFGGFSLQSLDTQTLQRFLISLNWTHKSKRTLKSRMNIFFKYCNNMGYIKENPIALVILPRYTQTLEDYEKKQKKFLSKEEMSMLLSSMNKNCLDIRQKRIILLFEFLFLTGLRIGEALALRWENIDLDKNILHVKYNLDYHTVKAKEGRLSLPKTVDSIRKLFINDRCIEILLWYKKENEASNFQADFIFLNCKGNLHALNSLTVFLKRQAVKAKIPDKNPEDFSTHLFRHSHISLLAEMGLPVKTIMQRVGHKNEKTTLQIYTHVTQSMEEAILEKLNEITL